MVVVAVEVMLLAGAVGSCGDEPQWEVGRCVTPKKGEGRKVVRCTDAAATAKIIKIDENASLFSSRSPLTSDSPCPQDVDEVAERASFAFVSSSAAEGVACLRNLKPPHPGEPGKGGGIIRPGDCVQSVPEPDSEVTEKLIEEPCGRKYWAKVVQWARKEEACPKRGSETRSSCRLPAGCCASSTGRKWQPSSRQVLPRGLAGSIGSIGEHRLTVRVVGVDSAGSALSLTYVAIEWSVAGGDRAGVVARLGFG